MPTLTARQALRRLLPYYHPYRLQVAAGLGSVVLAAALSALVPSFLQRGIDAIRDGAPPTAILRLGGVMLVTAVASGLLRFVMRLLLNGISRRMTSSRASPPSMPRGSRAGAPATSWHASPTT